jgi:hypothetical protein
MTVKLLKINIAAFFEPARFDVIHNQSSTEGVGWHCGNVALSMNIIIRNTDGTEEEKLQVKYTLSRGLVQLSIAWVLENFLVEYDTT